MKKVFAFLMFAFSVTGCDPIWIQQSFVAADNASFPNCVSSAIAGLQGVEVVPEPSTPRQVVLKTPQGIAVVRPAGNETLEVRFSQFGFSESDATKEAITPLLGSITARLASTCKG